MSNGRPTRPGPELQLRHSCAALSSRHLCGDSECPLLPPHVLFGFSVFIVDFFESPQSRFQNRPARKGGVSVAVPTSWVLDSCGS